MRAPVSIIIPTLNAEADLPLCLNGLGEGLKVGLIRELIVSDGGSTDATLEIAAQAGAEVVAGPPGRGGQLQRGVEASTGTWLLIVHADTRLCDGWAETALQHLVTDRAAWFRLAFRAEGAMPRLVAGWANLRARMGLPYGDQGLLLPRRLYDRAGGYPDIPLMEDVALVRALGGRMIGLDAVAETGAERYLARGWLRRGARNMLNLLKYLAGADPHRLARAYDRP